ncbi:MAG: acyl-CoA dehydrogenase [Pelagibacteraceae bacterium]|mgnify:CR=1 FL=1|nr:acyl-CoA dehydrogenase [Pelagibacteraceae bacterium]PPR10907.1 MAG: Acryloyl-CoA reductase (NADH) [Alphaproteobacteria bacterium MarineAlpha11_Bin1]|tara:strand:+ start:4750 stop:5910 length:1161 start_codon:yes stop_codon:yes gene_type:complete
MSISFRTDSEDEKSFRTEVRGWISENLPDDLRGWSTRPPFDRAMWWHRALHSKGWIAPAWPRVYGGMEANLNEQIILKEEFARAGAPEISAQGINHVGPVLMEFGTDLQKERYLPPILTGEETWCQGYSEPGAGSDLASLRTRADIDGKYLIVNGSKIWTTWAHYSDWIYALVRTDPKAQRKQAGISFVMIELKTPGINIRPIKTITGDEEFAEVFFDDVRVPLLNLVGKLNDGWRVANALLAHERLGTANPQLLFEAIERVQKVARSTGAMDDPYFLEHLAEVNIDTIGFAAMFAHAAEIANAERSLGLDASIMKINGTELLQRICDLLLEAAGTDAALVDRINTDEGPIEIAPLFMQVRRATIYGGSNEIQRNILSKKLLGLPK